MFKKSLFIILGLFILSVCPEDALSVPPAPARIGGTVTVEGMQLTQDTDDDYTFKVTQQNGTDYVDWEGTLAEDTDGLNDADWYVIDIPIYDPTDQPNGANPGDTAVIHAYKDGGELSIIPSKSTFTVGESGSVTQFNIVINRTPTADAGSNQIVDEGDTVTLNGSNSSDPDTGDSIAFYLWTQTAGTSVTLDDSTAAQPTFTAPDVGVGGESLTFQLTVTDTGGLQDDDTCIVNVTFDNQPPAADAGPDQTVDGKDTVTLNGSNSSDPDTGDSIASYLWTQTAGTSVTLDDSTAAQPTFTAPDVGVGGESLTFQLTVTDTGGLQDDDTCIVNVVSVNQPPAADAGSNQIVDEGDTVTLDGSNSTDPDSEIASYLWTQTDGTPITLSDPTSAKPTFLPPPVDANGTALTFQLTVEDSSGLQGTDDVTITILDNGITGFPDDVVTTTCSTGESIGVATESGGSCVSLTAIDPSTIADTTNMPEDLIYGLFDVRIKTDTPGSTVMFLFYLPSPAPDGYTWFKYSSTTGWSDFSANAAFNDTRDRVSLTLVDGGAGDDDGDANGIILDPSGLGYSAPGPGPTPTPEGGGGGGGGGCFISAAFYGL